LLPADPVGSFPQELYCLLNSLVVQAWTSGSRSTSAVAESQYADRMLAVVAREAHELIENATAFIAYTASIPLPDRRNQLPSRRHAESARHVLPPSNHSMGSKLREATTRRR